MKNVRNASETYYIDHMNFISLKLNIKRRYDSLLEDLKSGASINDPKCIDMLDDIRQMEELCDELLYKIRKVKRPSLLLKQEKHVL